MDATRLAWYQCSATGLQNQIETCQDALATREFDPHGKINYIEKLGEDYRDIFNKSHKSIPNETVNLNEKILFLRSDLTLESIKFSKKYDVIYFDAFAPSRQPEIWEKENLEKIYSHMNLNSILVTYCSSGQFKRDLRRVGFDIDILPGPVGKREMVRAIK